MVKRIIREDNITFKSLLLYSIDVSEEDSSTSGKGSIVNLSITVAPDTSIEFKGSLESVYKKTIDFIVKQFPEMDMINKILLNYSTDYLVKKYSSLITVNRDRGTVQVLAQPDKLTEEVAVVEPSEPARITDDFHSSSDSIMQLSSSESGNEITLKEEPSASDVAKKWKWSLKELIGLHLIASRIANGLGMSQDEGLQIYEIESATQANSKSINSRLSEMTKSGLVLKDIKFSDPASSEVSSQEEKPYAIYTITTVGIHWLNHIINRKEKV
jgi:hypothetical protein